MSDQDHHDLLKSDRPITYEQARELARHPDSSVRRELAGRDDIKPEILYFLAEDKDPQVRRAIAENSAAPRKADLLLAGDDDQEVRIGMAEKIAQLAPGLTSFEQDSIRKMTYEALELLARDQVTTVRQIVAESLKEIADAPPEVIRQLAFDAELIVSGPVLEFSPVLTDEDLQEIIASKPVKGALGAVSRRKNLGEAVSDAIAGSNDLDAIAELLGNTSAQIREETLDGLIERAADVESFQKPLVSRPRLPRGAAGRLAHFVAESMLGILTARRDLDPLTAREVRSVVSRRLDKKPKEPREIETIPLDRMDEAREVHSAGMLGDSRLKSALYAGDRDFAAAALVVRSGLAEKTIMRAISLRDVKGITAIAHRARLSPTLLEHLQSKLCRIPPREVLASSNGRDYPLDESEMKRRIRYLEHPIEE